MSDFFEMGGRDFEAAAELQTRRLPTKIRAAAMLRLVFCFILMPGGQTQNGGADSSASSQRSVTFNKDVAPILFKNCSWCHRPGQAAPFTLLTVADARKHAEDIVKVTASRYMPPWLPERGSVKFADERGLTDGEIELLRQWVTAGAREGQAADLPPRPAWDSGWILGKPDLVVQAPAYELSAEGKDQYRNFVVPIPVATRRFVRGVEFNPGNSRVVHHAFINVDETRRSRRRAAQQNPPGWDGMEVPETAIMPGGQLLGWQPGKVASFAPKNLAWVLNPNTDLVLQVHMNRTGKAELVQPSVAFYFTDEPPTNSTFRLKLTSLNLDIPPGDAHYQTVESYTLPVDVAVIRAGAHAHYLATEMKGDAFLPSGEKRALIHIKNWDFKWQGDYTYAEPIWLPRGSRIVLDYAYDNSTNNIRNPNHPPKRVRFGLDSKDEMGELYFQLLPRTPQDFTTLARDFAQYFLGISTNYFTQRIAFDPADAQAHKRLGRALGALDKGFDAVLHLLKSIQLQPNDDETHFDLGSVYIRQGRLGEAYGEFSEVVRLNPEDSQAYGSLGIICWQARRVEEAWSHFENALRINPEDALARKYLQMIKAQPP